MLLFIVWDALIPMVMYGEKYGIVCIYGLHSETDTPVKFLPE